MEPFNSTGMKIRHGVRLERFQTSSGKVLGKMTVARESDTYAGKTVPASTTSIWIRLAELREMRDWINRLLESEGMNDRSLPTAVGTVVRHEWTDEHGSWSVDYVRVIGADPQWGQSYNVWRSLARTPNGDYTWKNDANLLAAGTVTVLYPEDDE